MNNKRIINKTNRTKLVSGVVAFALIGGACGTLGSGAVDIVDIERTGPAEILLIADTCGSEPMVESWEVDATTRAIEVSVKESQARTSNDCLEPVSQTLPDDGEWTITDATSGNQFTAVEAALERASFWDSLATTGDEVESFGSLQEMYESADLVVSARVTGIELGRTVQFDTPEDVVIYASVTLDVGEVHRGDASPPVAIEFLMPESSTEAATQSTEMLSDSLPTEQALFFLRAKQGQGEEGLFRLVNSAGLFVESESQLFAPLDTGNDTLGDEAASFRSIHDLANALQDNS